MKQELVTKFKLMFEEQKRGLKYSYQWVSESLTIRPEEMSDEMDLTSVELEQGMSMRLKKRESHYLKKIDEALVRIQAGTFGVCEDCEEEIEASRLEARPTATFCLCCKEQQEQKEKRVASGRVLQIA